MSIHSLLVFLLSLSSCPFLVHADLGRSPSDFTAAYGPPVGNRPTPSGQAMAFKSGGLVIMAEFDASGKAKNVAYRSSSMAEPLIQDILSRSRGVTGPFFPVNRPLLNQALDNLSKPPPPNSGSGSASGRSGAGAPAFDPSAMAALKQAVASVPDLRGTDDGRFVAFVDPRGSVLVLEINGPVLPLRK